MNAERRIRARSATNWCAGTLSRPQQYLAAREPDVASHVDRIAPGADDLPRRGEGRGELIEPDPPFAAPDVEVHVDDVVVRHCEPAQLVADLEGPVLVERAVVPDDPSLPVEVCDPVGARGVGAAEIGAAAGPVALAVLEHLDARDLLTGRERDLAVAARRTARRTSTRCARRRAARRSRPSAPKTSACGSV